MIQQDITPELKEIIPTTASGRKRWTRAQFEFVENAGLLEGRYELIDGEIISKMGQLPQHAITVTQALVWLSGIFGGRRVRTQATLQITGVDGLTNRPEPDIMVLSESAAEVMDRAPFANETLLVVEVSATTQDDDFGFKVGLYARGGVPEYWVIDVTARTITLFRDSDGTTYQSTTVLTAADTIAPIGLPTQVVVVNTLLP